MNKEYFSQFVYQDPESGELFWKYRDPSNFGSALWHSRWNSRFAGQPAFSIERLSDRYERKVLRLNCRSFIYCRVLLIMHGILGSYDDSASVDHIDGNPKNNKIENLRLVDASENMRNKRIYKSNKSGVHGVSRSRNGKRWCARIGVKGKGKLRLGTFDSFFDAVCARKAAEVRVGYHQNHGA